MAYRAYEFIVPAWDEAAAEDLVNEVLREQCGSHADGIDGYTVGMVSPYSREWADEFKKLRAKHTEDVLDWKQKIHECLKGDGNDMILAHYCNLLSKALYQEFCVHMPFGYYDCDGFSYHIPNPEKQHDWGWHYVVHGEVHF